MDERPLGRDRERQVSTRNKRGWLVCPIRRSNIVGAVRRGRPPLVPPVDHSRRPSPNVAAGSHRPKTVAQPPPAAGHNKRGQAGRLPHGVTIVVIPACRESDSEARSCPSFRLPAAPCGGFLRRPKMRPIIRNRGM